MRSDDRLAPQGIDKIQGASYTDTDNLDASLYCVVCSQALDSLTGPQREEHYQLHVTNNAQTSPKVSNQVYVIDVDAKKSWKAKMKWTATSQRKDKDVFWYPMQLSKPPVNFTPGFIPLLKKALLTSHSKGNLHRAVLCYERTVHIHRENFDIGWGCGYRNFLMSCAALMDQQFQPLYYPLLDSPISPGVRNLQVWIEAAWKAGFDEDGARELKKLVNSSKWLGTSDLWVAFSFRGIPAQLVDFNLTKQSQGTQIVTDWIVKYFTPEESAGKRTNAFDALRGASPVISTNRMPIILQHHGHSRVIVGYQVAKNGLISLLQFDPSYTPSQKVRNAAVELFMASFSAPNPAKNSESSMTSTRVRKRSQSVSTNQKRRASDVSTIHPDVTSKRRRSVLNVDEDSGRSHEVIVIDDEDDTFSQERKKDITVKDQLKLLTNFSYNLKATKQKHFQILYFSMDEPLTEKQKMLRHVVTSEKIC